MKYLEMVVGSIAVISAGFCMAFGDGASALDNNKDIHYANVQSSDNVSLSSVDGLNIEYSANLDYPGDSYDVTFDIVNSTGVDMFISNFVWPDSDLIDYNLKYVDGSEVKHGDLIKKDEVKKVIYTVVCKDNVSFDEDFQLDTSFDINFEQAL